MFSALSGAAVRMMEHFASAVSEIDRKKREIEQLERRQVESRQAMLFQVTLGSLRKKE